MILSANVLELLNRQYSHEMANSIFYRLLASWAEMRGLDGTAKFFSGQSADEIKHAESVAAYIEDRNEELSFDVLAPVNTKPATYSDAFTAAQDVERATSEAVYAIKAQAMAEADYMTFAWIDALVKEQVEEENIIQTILDRLASRMGATPLNGTDVTQAEMPGEVIHDIDAWLAAR